MTGTLFIHDSHNRKRYVLMENGLPVRYAIDPDPNEILPEDIYFASADQNIPGMAACYVRLNGRKNGFLPYTECLGRIPSSGEKVIVQIKRAPHGSKCAYVTMDISLAGTYSVLLPFSQKRSVSSRIVDPTEKQRLITFANTICPRHMGIILRSESVHANPDTIRDELFKLIEQSSVIMSMVRSCKPPVLLKRSDDPLTIFLREETEITSVISDNPLIPDLSGLPIQVSARAYNEQNISSLLKKAFSRNVPLPCGGYITVDICEALTVIDVNSGQYKAKHQTEQDSFLTVNLEAARTAARILRLRNIGGIILIDFIDMDREENRLSVTNELAEAFSHDRTKCVIHGFTSLGLLEITRKRSGIALTPDMLEDQPNG